MKKNHQKKKRIKKYQGGTLSDRLQYRKGQRVSYAQAGRVEPAVQYKEEEKEKEKEKDEDEDKDDDNRDVTDDTPPAKSQMTGTTTASQERTKRIAETAEETTRRAQGQMPEKNKNTYC